MANDPPSIPARAFSIYSQPFLIEYMQRMKLGERDKKTDEMASKAAAAFCRKHANATDEQIEASPETYLHNSIPYLTVRTLHRHEKALKSLEADSRWIKFLTIVLAGYAWRLDALVHSLSH